MNFKNLAIVGGLLVSTVAAVAPANAYDHYWRHHSYNPYRSTYVNTYPMVRNYNYNPGYYNTGSHYDGYHTYSNGGLGLYYPSSRGERIAGRVLDMIF